MQHEGKSGRGSKIPMGFRETSWKSDASTASKSRGKRTFSFVTWSLDVDWGARKKESLLHSLTMLSR